MHIKLPTELSVQIFSFFSQTELRNFKAINKESGRAIKSPILWQKLLKQDFFVTEEKISHCTEALYDKYLLRMQDESGIFIECAPAYLCSLRVKEDFGAFLINEDNYRHRNEQLDYALFNGIDKLREKVACLFQRPRELNYEDLRRDALTFIDKYSDTTPSISLNKYSIENVKQPPNYNTLTYAEQSASVMMLVLPKINAYTILNRLLHMSQMPQVCLDEMLFIACQFLHCETISLLIKFGANPNAVKVGELNPETTPLFQTFMTAWFHKLPPERYQPVFKLLLKEGANPDFTSDDKAVSLRKYCKVISQYRMASEHKQLIQTISEMPTLELSEQIFRLKF